MQEFWFFFIVDFTVKQFNWCCLSQLKYISSNNSSRLVFWIWIVSIINFSKSIFKIFIDGFIEKKHECHYGEMNMTACKISCRLDETSPYKKQILRTAPQREGWFFLILQSNEIVNLNCAGRHKWRGAENGGEGLSFSKTSKLYLL